MQTLTFGLEDLSSADGASSGAGFFARLIKSREDSARRRAIAYLAAQSDERLASLGFDAGDIAALRAGELRTPAAR